MLSRFWLAVLLVVAAAAAGCGPAASSTSAPTHNAPTPAGCNSKLQSGADVFSQLVALTTRSDGLQVGDYHVGCGAVAENGDSLAVEYTGWLSNGTEFDSSRTVGRTAFSFVLGKGQVIKGWDLGVVGMRVGGKRRLVVPPSLAYASTANGVIPANSTLTFDVELISIN